MTQTKKKPSTKRPDNTKAAPVKKTNPYYVASAVLLIGAPVMAFLALNDMTDFGTGLVSAVFFFPALIIGAILLFIGTVVAPKYDSSQDKKSKSDWTVPK